PVTNSSAFASASSRAATSADVPPRYHQSQPTKTKETATHTRDQIPASRIDTALAPRLFRTMKSIASATRTKIANSDHSRGVPMEIIGEDLFTGVAGTGRRGWSKVLAGLADRSDVA